jgi:hypothetical protein
VDYAKYLGTIINKTEGIGKEEIRNRIDQSKKKYIMLKFNMVGPTYKERLKKIYW